MKRVTIIITLCLSLASIVVPILWGQYQKEYKELTIEEIKRVNIGDLFGKEFASFINDSIKINNCTITEYKITNTGNTTLIGVGAQSDILLPSNKIPIVGDSIYIKLEKNKIARLDSLKYLMFSQIRPQESFTILCATTNNANGPLIDISDRDIKNTNIVYKAYSDKLTSFEKTSLQTKWFQTISFIFNIVLLFILVILFVVDIYSDIKTQKGKLLYTIYCTIWILSCMYICSLPIRWLL